MRMFALLVIGVAIFTAMATRPRSSARAEAASAPRGIDVDAWTTPSTTRAVARASTRSATTMPANFGETVLTREADGHYYAQAEVNSAQIRFVVDTGASTIALTQDDARRAGIPFDSNFVSVGSGASGDVYGAPITIDTISVDGHQAQGLSGVVLRDADRSLLGMSFLSRFGSVRMEGEQMILK